MGNHYTVVFLYSAFLKYFTDFFKAVKSCRLLFKVLAQFIPILPKYKVILLEKQNKTPCYDPRPSDRISILISGEITPIVEPHLLVNTNAPSAGHIVPCPKVQNSGEEQ